MLNFYLLFGFENEQDYVYRELLHNFYYSKNNLNYNLLDICFSNFNIISYENEKASNERLSDSTFYNYFRKTSVYDYTKNWLGGNYYSLQYTDSEDVSAMLPSGSSVEYLTSPFYKYNENSSSGGYITYDINEILQGDKIIDYSKEDNSIHNNFNGDYIENYTEGDNIVINNYYTTTIDKTSDEHLLHNIYITLLQIRTILDGMGDSISNTTNNFTYNITNTVTYYIKPSQYNYNYYHNRVKSAFQERLSFIYDPFVCIRYFFTGLSGIVAGNEDIVLDIPSVSWQDVQIIPQTTFNFTTYMENDIPVLNTIHTYYLSFIDFVCVGFLANLAYKKWKEMMDK